MPTSSTSSSVHLTQLRPRIRPIRATTDPSTVGGGAMKSQSDVPKKASSINDALGKSVVRYRECRKNHAASVGGHAVDGCREFMPAGEEGTAAALRCAACTCHRSFHKREVESEALCDCGSNSTSPS